MATGVVTKKNLWPIIKANLSLAKGSYAAVGFPGDSAKSKKVHPQSLGEGKSRKKTTGLTNVDIAIINEFGTPAALDGPGIPSRPFMRQTFGYDRRKKFQDEGAKLLGMIAKGEMSTRIALGRLGTMGSSAVKDEITHPKPPFLPNAPYTVAKKKSSHPLIDTGAMRAAVTHKVRMKSGIGAK